MLPNSHILLIDDAAQGRHDLGVILSFLGEDAIIADSAGWQEAVNAAVDTPSHIRCVILGHCAHAQGLPALLGQLDKWDENLPVILLDPEQSLLWPDHLKQRLLAVFEPPLSYNHLLDALHRAQVYREVFEENSSRQRQREPNLFRSLVGTSRPIQAVRQMMQQVADTEATVLILGESGTGKEVVARNLHYHSRRKDAPFVPVNCGAIPAELLESELFGHEKGAFTGAITSRAGRFELAQGGTLFLDEIGDMPLALQAKLLRVLQEGEIRPLGSTRSHRVDLRIIAATHQRLHEQVQRGLFREDLYYRLGHFPIELPPLRERGSDIRQLALHFASDTCTFLQRSPCHWSDSALAYLASHRFPGNVRELKGLIARALLLCDGNLLLPEHLQLPGTPEHAHRLGLREQLEVVERNLLIEGLQLHGGNQTLTAQALGLPRRTLLYRMQRLGVTADTPK